MIEILLPIDIASKSLSRFTELLSVSLIYNLVTVLPKDPSLLVISPVPGGGPDSQR